MLSILEMLNMLEYVLLMNHKEILAAAQFPPSRGDTGGCNQNPKSKLQIPRNPKS